MIRGAPKFGQSFIWALLSALLLTLSIAAPSRAALTFPTLTGRVVDDAHILSPQIQADLSQQLAALEAKTSRQLIVVTVPTLQGDDIADYGYQLGRAWGVGQKTVNNGTLFIVAPNERKVRIEVGYGVEGVLTDAMSNVILQRSVLPKFRAGDMPGGVVDGTQALAEQLSLDPSTAEQRLAEAANAQRATHYGGRSSNGGPFGLIVVIFVIIFVLRSVLSGGGGGGIGWFLPGLFLGGMMGGGRRDDDWGGGGGGFGGGGGGFGGGGGGSFGGGGSSGSW